VLDFPHVRPPSTSEAVFTSVSANELAELDTRNPALVLIWVHAKVEPEASAPRPSTTKGDE
jgi:hypothetical protein